MKKILLIGIYGSKSVSLAPHILKAYVEQFDISKKFEILTEEFDIFSDNLIDEVISRVNFLNPEIVGFSTYIWNIKEILEITKFLKTTIILGGPQVTGIEKELLEHYQNIDFIITGEGELTFKELLEYFENERNLKDVIGITTRSMKTIREDYICLDDIPSSYEEIFERYSNLEWIGIETSRGCCFNCGFCAWSKLFKKMRYLSLKRVKRDLRLILKQKNIKYIYICDSNILFNKSRAKKIIKFLVDQECSKIVKFEFDYRNFDDEVISLLDKLPNQEFNIGIQTINPLALKIMNKTFLKDHFEKQLKKMSDGLSHSRIGIDVIYGLPGDDLDGYKKTLDYIISLDKIEKIVTNHLLLLPGSDFFYNRERYGIKTIDYVVTENFSFSSDEMALAKKYSFYVFVVYLNHRLKECIKSYAIENKVRYIDMIITFMDSLCDSIFEGKFPHLLASNKRDLKIKYNRIANIVEKYQQIVEAFKIFSKQKYSYELKNYERHFSSYYNRYNRMYVHANQDND